MMSNPLNRSVRRGSVYLRALLCAGALCGGLLCASWFAIASPAQQTPATPAERGTAAAGSSDESTTGQPIAFSHRLHAGDLQIRCVYCHSAALRSAAAGVPAVGVCTGCHRWVKNKTGEMAKLDEHQKTGQPVVWKRINQLDDYVYFSHKRHVSAGLECQGCHGQVEAMEQVQRIERLTMGWCVTCHEQRHAPLDCSTCHR